jgi:hypothetical protein
MNTIVAKAFIRHNLAQIDKELVSSDMFVRLKEGELTGNLHWESNSHTAEEGSTVGAISSCPAGSPAVSGLQAEDVVLRKVRVMVKRLESTPVSRSLTPLARHSSPSFPELLSRNSSDVGKTGQEDIVFRGCNSERVGESILTGVDAAAPTVLGGLVPFVLISKLNYRRFQAQVWEVHYLSAS